MCAASLKDERLVEFPYLDIDVMRFGDMIALLEQREDCGLDDRTVFIFHMQFCKNV